MGEGDYIGVYWTDIATDRTYKYFSDAPYNEVAYDTKIMCEKLALSKYREIIDIEIEESMEQGVKFVDAYEQSLANFVNFEVWGVLPDAPLNEITDDNLENFLHIHCVREG